MISLCLINSGRDDDLVACAECIARHRVEKPLEVLVVERGTSDPALKAVRSHIPAVEVVPADAFGVASMRNVAFGWARGEIVVFLDTDARLCDGALDAIVRAFERDEEAGVVGAKVLNPDLSLQYSARRFYTLRSLILRRLPGCAAGQSKAVRAHLMSDWDHGDARDVDWVVGACFCIRASAAAEIGPFSEDSAFGFEDVDYCRRAWHLGWRVRYEPEAVVIHEFTRSSYGLNRRTLSHLRGLLGFIARTKFAQPAHRARSLEPRVPQSALAAPEDRVAVGSGRSK